MIFSSTISPRPSIARRTSVDHSGHSGWKIQRPGASIAVLVEHAGSCANAADEQGRRLQIDAPRIRRGAGLKVDEGQKRLDGQLHALACDQ